jgi:WD40 repeat protein
VINESVVASGSQGELNSIRVWNLADGTCMATLKGHKNTVSALVVLQKGTILASSSHDGTIKIWDWRQN